MAQGVKKALERSSSRSNKLFGLVGALLGTLAVAMPAQASPRVYENEEQGSWVELGILIEAQYRLENQPTDGTEHNIWLRRLRPTVSGGFNEDWQAILQLDFGAGATGDTYRVTVRWVNFQYVGVKNSHLAMGSFKNWFSREFITLGPQLQIIERTFVGENTYGNPAYTIGVGWDHLVANDRIFYAANIGAQNVSTDADKMAFNSPANGDSTDNTGWSASARADFYALGQGVYGKEPLGYKLTPYDRSDVTNRQSWLLSFSVAGYGWWNQNNNNGQCAQTDPTTCTDLRNAFGVEGSGGVRGFGFSADFEYQFVRGDAVDGTYTGGLYQDGRTNLHKATVNAGYMIIAEHFELAAAWSLLSASNYGTPWNRAIVGLNGFVKGYNIRFSADYVREINLEGTDQKGNVFRTQAQFAW
jgi:hypothetical protein